MSIDSTKADFLNLGVIGLGVMGQRMLERLQGHARLRASWVWDANPAALAQTLARYPHLRAADSAEALIQSRGLHSLYIATPPAAHLRLSELGFDAGLAVFCEKPLTVDFPGARRCIARIEAEGQRAAVNFALASSPGLALLQQRFGAEASAPSLGRLQHIELELAFAAWPRPWQAAAGAWLAEREEGGFSREVLSHFIFAAQRVLGPARLLRSEVIFPAEGRGAETQLTAELEIGGVPLRIHGRVGGEQADLNRMVWQGERGTLELSEWFTRIQDSSTTAEALAPELQRERSRLDQLDQWAALIESRPHGLPGFAESLAVQESIEALLQPRA